MSDGEEEKDLQMVKKEASKDSEILVEKIEDD